MLHAGVPSRVVVTGQAALDAELPGGGWPLGGLVDLLQPEEGEAPLWPLLLPALAVRQRGGAVLLMGVPQPPYLPALAAAGLLPTQVLWAPDECPWMAEQALRCAGVAAVLAWLPHAREAELRRLHLTAAQRGDVLLFAVRPAQAARGASPAPLRLRLELGEAMPQGLPGQGAAPLLVHIVKRRGPPLAAPLRLPVQPPVLRALLAAGAARQGAGAQVLPFPARWAGRPEGARDVDRLAVAA
ncbi:MAG: hypothetical protein H6928_09320 [Burkholderiaceae bacterium]|nr:hypothetical protein [Ottowia sp.]MCB2032920.1 hypothetical protein [Ottowia sp.]MCP5258144.1 hypothetical protein [Burkholderiaceae bacterium]